MRYGLRRKTKDVDLVVSNEEEFKLLTDTLLSLGFRKEVPDAVAYGRMALSHILLRDNARVDLFCRAVCGRFALSEKMRERASPDLSLNNVRLLVCSLDDVFLFKCMTERDGDLEDCERIARDHALDWNAILDEAVKQCIHENSVWITWITDRMELLAERGVRIPILKKMVSLTDDYIKKWGRELEERCGNN